MRSRYKIQFYFSTVDVNKLKGNWRKISFRGSKRISWLEINLTKEEIFILETMKCWKKFKNTKINEILLMLIDCKTIFFKIEITTNWLADSI